MIIFALIVIAAILLVFMLSACRAAGMADEQMEKAFCEWQARQLKEQQEDFTLKDA